jgi:hypothetical protein
MPECVCGAWVSTTNRRFNACGREVNPHGSNALTSEAPKHKKMGSVYQPDSPHGGDHVAPWEILGKPEEDPVTGILESPSGRKKHKRQEAPPRRLRRRITLHRRPDGTAVFRLIVLDGETLESAPFPTTAECPKTRITVEVFNRFVDQLRRSGWRKTGSGKIWFEVELTHPDKLIS